MIIILLNITKFDIIVIKMHKKKNPFVSSDAKYLLFMPILIFAAVILLVGIVFQISKQSYAQVTYWTDSGNYATEFGGTDANGSFYKPYLISTPEQLARLAYFTNTGELKKQASQSAY